MASLSPNRTPWRGGSDLFLYDQDCSFCRASAAWLQRRARQPLALLPIAEAPRAGVLATLSDRERWASAHFVTAEGVQYHGGAAVTRALRLGRGGRAWALFDAPLLAWLRDACYALLTRLRGRLGCWACR